MQFLLDENLSPTLCEMLNAAGHDAVSVASVGLAGSCDADIWHSCIQQGRLLITLDGDFADTRVYPPTEGPGVIWLRQKPEDSTSAIHERLLRFLLNTAESELAGRLTIIRHSKIRVVGT